MKNVNFNCRFRLSRRGLLQTAAGFAGGSLFPA